MSEEDATKPPQNEMSPNDGKRPGRLTLSQLAEQIGLSTATISLALRNSPMVAETTRERVQDAAREAGYIPNRSAAALRTARSNVVGVAVHDILNPYFAEIFRALEDALGEEDQVVFICNHRDDVERQRAFTEALLQHRADGLVLCPSIDTTAEEVNRLMKHGLPVTLICRDVEGVVAPVIRGDDVRGMRQLCEVLISQRHRHIAMIGGRQASSAGHLRREGWAQALEAAGIDVRAQLHIPELMTRLDGYNAVDRLLAFKPRPTAVICFNDMIARGLIEALRRSGLDAGHDIAVAGYDDTIGSATSTPSLTSVDNSATEIGKRAAKMILAQVSGEAVGAERVLIAPTLTLRESTSAGAAV